MTQVFKGACPVCKQTTELQTTVGQHKGAPAVFIAGRRVGPGTVLAHAYYASCRKGCVSLVRCSVVSLKG